MSRHGIQLFSNRAFLLTVSVRSDSVQSDSVQSDSVQSDREFSQTALYSAADKKFSGKL